ncbi:glycosyltransferase family 4 protein [Halomonas sp. SCS19]
MIEKIRNGGDEVYCFAADYTDRTKREIRALGGIPIDYKISRGGVNPIKDFMVIISLSRLFKSLSLDVVIGFFVKPSMYSSLAGAIAKTPRRLAMLEGLGYIHTPVNGKFSVRKNLLRVLHGVMCTFFYYFSDKIIFLNRDDPVDLSRFSIINKDKIEILGPIGVKVGSYKRSELDLAKPLRFVFVARLLLEKGIYEFLSAAKKIKKEYPEVEFVVLGEVDKENPSSLSRDELSDAIDSGIVIHPGYVDDVERWLASSHVFVLPSYREGFPRSTQEAMATGLPVITTNVPGCRETVEDGVNGFIVAPFDADALAEKFLFYIENPKSLKDMGEESYRIARRDFNVDDVDERLKDLIKNC